MVKNVVHINEHSEIKSALKAPDFEPILKQKPNRKILFVLPFHLLVWNFAQSHSSERKFNEYLRTTVGEPPVIFEPVLLEKTTEQMKQLLSNEGYFRGSVTADTISKKRLVFKFLNPKKKVRIHYFIETGNPYLLKRISFALEDTALSRVIDEEGLEIRKQSALRSGSRFQVEKFDEERERITNLMKDLGYFTFDPIHVVFDVDTNLKGDFFNIAIRFRNLRSMSQIEGRDTLIESAHKKYKLNQIIINENFIGSERYQSSYDSISYKNCLYLFRSKPNVNPSRLSRNIFVQSGDYFSKSKTNYTYERINSLGTFKFIDLKYEVVKSSANQGLLDLKVNLTEAPKQAITLEGIGTNRSGNLGVSTSLNYKNRNLFKGAEQFDLKLYGGLEAQRTNSTINSETTDFITKGTPFNTYEYGVQALVTIPDLLFRTARRELPWFKEPKTTISASADRQVRPQYDRALINLSYQMIMRLRAKDQLIIAPIDLSVIDLKKDIEFEKQLLQTRNSLLINSYNNHIIPAGRITYNYTTQDFKNSNKNYYLYKLNFETAGNIARTLAKTFHAPYDPNRDSYFINNIAFSQYVKLDADYSKHFVINDLSRTVYRGTAGIGVPLSNLNTLPFERSFFAGGANDMRAWQARGLGPGSLSDTATYGIDQVGELKLEINIEYRFKIIKQLEGALFTDIGNIWILAYDPLRPGADFDLNRFYKELAIGPGAGIRFNFDFFILRLDGGLQLKDPNLPEGERWVFQPKTLTNAYRNQANVSRSAKGLPLFDKWKPEYTFNIGIGYPF